MFLLTAVSENLLPIILWLGTNSVKICFQNHVKSWLSDQIDMNHQYECQKLSRPF